MTREIRTLVPYLAVVGLACLLMVAEPDLGTAIVVCLATGALLVAAGVKIRHLALLGRRRSAWSCCSRSCSSPTGCSA